MSVMKFEKVLTTGNFVFTSGNGNAIVRVTPSPGSTYTVTDNVGGGTTGAISAAQDIMLGNTDNIAVTVTAGSVVISSQAGIS